jgi:LUC7 N_terminus
VYHCRPPRRLDDPKLCKNFLLGFCPGEEFQRTKHDYGTCALDHDEAAKAQVREPSTHPACYLSAERMVTLAMLAAIVAYCDGLSWTASGVTCIVTAAMNLYVCQGLGSSPWLSGLGV